jgi:predicted nucleic acid-binding protein
VIFLDTSAVYALADRADANHRRATRMFAATLAAGEGILTHNYVMVESMALLQHRLGLAAALAFAEDAKAFEVLWITPDLHDQAVAWLGGSGRRRVSLVDAASFIVMRARRVEVAFAFDAHFTAEGFRLLTPSD